MYEVSLFDESLTHHSNYASQSRELVAFCKMLLSPEVSMYACVFVTYAGHSLNTTSVYYNTIKAASVEVNISPSFPSLGKKTTLHPLTFLCDIAVFVLKSDVKLRPTNQPTSPLFQPQGGTFTSCIRSEVLL